MRGEELKIHILQRNEIDSIRWDKLVERSAYAHPSLRSAYLDAVCPQWSAAVMGDWHAAMPVLIKQKWGIRYASMPLFVQQTGCLSPQPMSVDPFIHSILQKVSLLELSANETDRTDIRYEIRNNYCLDISQEHQYIRANYNENTRRNCAKANTRDLHFQQVNDTGRAVHFFGQNNHKNKLGKEHFLILERLLSDDINYLSKCYEIVDNKDTIHSMAVFTSSMNRHVYTLSALTEQGRLQGAMFGLIDRYIQMHCGAEGRLIDFEGSNIAGVAQFYAGFGAVNRPYPFIKINKLPWPIKLLKH